MAAAIENREIAAITVKKELFKVKPLGFILKIACYAYKWEKPDVSTIKTILRSVRDMVMY